MFDHILYSFLLNAGYRKMKWRNLVFLVLCLTSFFAVEQGFYVPGVAPVEFKIGQRIDVKGIKLTSTKTIVPYEYYMLPFCRPPGNKIHYNSENLGEVMRGDRIVNTPFQVAMREDVLCNTTCEDHTKHLSEADSETLIRRIREDYHVHLLVDNLPCVTRYEIKETGEELHEHGYRLGWEDKGHYFVNNHLDIVLSYHQPTLGVFRVVGFEVSPRSIGKEDYHFENHTGCKIRDVFGHQEVLSGKNDIVWSYSVKWKESNVPWASRWDTYLRMKDVQIHWFSILNSIVVIICLSGFLSIIIVRTVRRDIDEYNIKDDDERPLEETGWKLVYGDVFRPPQNSMLFANIVGSGIQVVGMVAVTVFFAMLGMLSPASRGSLMSAAIFLYCFMGLVAGYHTGRLYKTLKGSQPKRCAFRTAVLFPSIILGIGFFLNFFLIGKHSSGAVPFTTMIALLMLWFGIDLPLVFLGFHFGYRKQIYSHPVRTNQIPRQVPDQPWYLHTLPCMLLAGILPFGAVFIELFFIFSAIWENQFYYLFGFLFIVCVILFVSCAQISIVVVYFLLCAENYHWWWKSFVISGGSAVYVMGYAAFYYFTKVSFNVLFERCLQKLKNFCCTICVTIKHQNFLQLNIVGFIPTLLYFSYSFLMALTFWLLTGTIGFYAAYSFICRIYGAVKID
ncbi:unnamed protein product [Enterobius vermicularis]|uniref:Transmembrane 9 superfamily member n=1 Tax=Enterobius vermicularis TaxID=51028 RepID=A0A0N4VBN0_ENTVE|nr:unnamed protein product [Enterobius vermicularis]